jgi:predicted ribonuclease YlaK
MSAVQYFDDETELYRISTRRERKLLNKRKRRADYKKDVVEEEVNIKFDLKYVEAKTDNQHKAFKSFYDDKNLLLHGVAGTGKTFLDLYLALESVIRGDAPKPIVILRSVVPSRDMGFLPGKIEEKGAAFELPYHGICAELTGHATAYEHMKKSGLIQFSTTSHLRGLTFRGNTIIIDECQNMTFSELDTIMTRVGKGCRVIFCGDFRQTDFWRDEEKSGLHKFMDVLKTMESFDAIEFTEEDIQRSGVVKEYILAKLAKGMV